MAIGESAGSVYVTIDGDATPLLAKYAQAESLSRAAGTRIAAGLGQGLSAASGIVDQFGNAVSSGITQPMSAAAPAAKAAAAAVAGIGSAAAASVSGINSETAAVNRLAGSMNEARIIGSSLRALQGTGVLAAERFLSSIPAISSFFRNAFPIFGAIALADMVGRLGEKVVKVADNFLHMRDAEEEVARVSKEMESGVESAIDNIRKLQVEALREQGKLVAAAQLEQANAAQKFIKIPQPDDKKIAGLSGEDLEKIKNDLANVLPADLGDRIRQVTHDLEDTTDLWVKLGDAADPITTHFRSQSATAIQLYGETLNFLKARRDEFDAEQQAAAAKVGTAAHEESTKELRTAKEFLDMQRQAFRDYYDSKLEDLKASHEVSREEELRFRQQELADKRMSGLAGADGNPVQRETRNQIGTLSQQVDKGIDSTVKKGRELQVEQAKNDLKTVKEEMMRGLEEASRDGERQMEEDLRTIQRTVAEGNRASEEHIKAGGDRTQSSDEVSKLLTEQQYALQIVHTRQQELQYAKDIAAADEQALSDKIANLEALKDYQQINALYDEANRTDLEIEKAKAALLKQQVEDATKLAAVTRSTSLAGQIQSAVGTGPANLLDAKNLVVANTMGSAVNGIASAFGKAVQGGQSLGRIFTQLGRSILGDVVQSIAKIGLQMATTALLGKSLGSSIAVAEVTSAAAVGAANAAASTAAIPIVGPALAPGVAAATFAEIMGFAALASYDKGGYIDSDQIARVHKGEFVLTADQMAGRTELPPLPVGGAIASHSLVGGSSTVSSFSIGQLHVHGMQSAESFARALPRVLKTRAPSFSPASS